MMNLVKLIQGIVLETVKASSPMDVRYATVKSLSPLTIVLQNNLLEVKSPVVSMCESLTEKKITVKWHDTTDSGVDNFEDDYVVRDGIAVGDKVVTLRFNSGQHYLIIDKVV